MDQFADRQGIFKTTILKRLGYTLVGVALIVATIISSAPELYVPRLGSYSFLILLAGVGLVAANKVLDLIQKWRLEKRFACCMSCGWVGKGSECFRHQCCPECDSPRIFIR